MTLGEICTKSTALECDVGVIVGERVSKALLLSSCSLNMVGSLLSAHQGPQQSIKVAFSLMESAPTLHICIRTLRESQL